MKIVLGIDLGTQSNYRAASLGAAGATVVAGNNSLTAEVTGFQTIYATLNITDWLYVKGGSVTVDVDTEYTQNGAKQSSYGNSHELDGTVFGVGVSNKRLSEIVKYHIKSNYFKITIIIICCSLTISRGNCKFIVACFFCGSHFILHYS